jgi:hypothetical protein
MVLTDFKSFALSFLGRPLLRPRARAASMISSEKWNNSLSCVITIRRKQKKGPARPRWNWREGLFVVAAVVRGIGWQDDQAAVDGEILELDREAGSFLVREGGADLGPALLCFAVILSESGSE